MPPRHYATEKTDVHVFSCCDAEFLVRAGDPADAAPAFYTTVEGFGHGIPPYGPGDGDSDGEDDGDASVRVVQALKFAESLSPMFTYFTSPGPTPSV